MYQWSFVLLHNYGDVLLHTPIIKYIFEMYLGTYVLQEVKTEKKYGRLKYSTVVVTLLYSTMLDNLPVKGLIMLDFLVFYSWIAIFSMFHIFQ